MVEIFDIRIDKEVISCSYSPENSGLVGKISVDTNSKEIVSVQYSEFKYGKRMYAAQVRQKLIELFKSGERIPNKAVVVWY